jgi:hypothetical protein
MDPTRWTPLTFLFPGRYVDRSEFWTDFDLETWSRETYDWDQDGWSGWRDVAAEPRETVDRGHGDCEDYALVAAAWAVARERDGVGIAFCWDPPWPFPTHVIAYDDERVYSSGRISEETVGEWVADSSYSFALERPVR